jgi:hypothetical protein
MSRIVAAEYLSLDGVTEDPGPAGEYEHRGWTVPYWNDDIEKWQTDQLFASNALLLGRVTYEEFVASWPLRSDDPFTDRMNSLPKFVASTTLEEPLRVEQHAAQRRCRRGGREAEAAAGRGHPRLRQRCAREHVAGTEPDRRIPVDDLSARPRKRQTLLQRRQQTDEPDAKAHRDRGHRRHDARLRTGAVTHYGRNRACARNSGSATGGHPAALQAKEPLRSSPALREQGQ